MTELQALRGIVFDTRHRQVKEILLKAGVHVSSTVLAPKLAPHGGQVQKNGENVFRMCTNCTGGPYAPNLTIHSADHTRQKTTTTPTVAFKIVQEEKRYPGHPVRLVKDEIAMLSGKWIRRLDELESSPLTLVLLSLFTSL